jgi:hypothetical protein
MWEYDLSSYNFFSERRLKGLLSAIAVHTQALINRLEAER